MGLSFTKGVEAVAEAGLGFPGELPDPACTVFLAFGELGTGLRRDAVMGGLLNEDPACVGVAAFADGSLSPTGAAGVFGRNKAEECHEFFGMFKTIEGSDLTDSDHGGNEFEAFECHQGINERFSLPVFKQCEHGIFNTFGSVHGGSRW